MVSHLIGNWSLTGTSWHRDLSFLQCERIDFRMDKETVRAIVNYLTVFRHVPYYVRVPYVAHNPSLAYVFNIEEMTMFSLMYLAIPTRQGQIK